MDLAAPHQFRDHGGHAAGLMEVFAQILAGGLQVHQKRRLVTDLFPGLERQIDARMARQAGQVDRGVGRAADGRVDDDGVLERLAGQDVRWLQVFVDHVDDALAGQVGDLGPFAIGGGDGGRAGQGHAQGLGQRVHRRRRAHGVAVADRGRRGRHQIDEFLIADLAGRHHLAGLPDDGAGTDALAPVPAVQHGADRQGDGGNVDGRRRHQAGGRGLVAADS